MCYYFRMECRRWAPIRRWLVFLGLLWLLDVGLTGWDIVRGLCRDAGEHQINLSIVCRLTVFRIVEYATRDQAQVAVNTLSNQNLMGRLVYVREVSISWFTIYRAFDSRDTGVSD